MKYIKLFDNHSNSLSYEVTSNIINDINDILIEVRDESNLGLVLSHQFQFDRKKVVFYISGKNSKEFNMKEILDEVLQIISYMESNGFPLISLSYYYYNYWYKCELVDKTIKGIKSTKEYDEYFDIEDMKSFGLIFSL